MRDLEALDEVLQIMFWLRNEGLRADCNAADLQRFVPSDADSLIAVLVRLEELGLVHRADFTPSASARFALTPDGMREAGRRFADEFADMTKPGHGECGDPDCECQRTGSREDCRHRLTGTE